MMVSCNVLILGGTTEARLLAERLTAVPGMAAIMSLAGRTAQPRHQPGQVRVGGFGGAAGLARYLGEQGIDVVVDATHPFAARISANAIKAAQRASVPLVRLERPQWEPMPGDDWIAARDAADAARQLPDAPATVFLAIGRQEIAPFAALGHRYIVRSVDPVATTELPRGATMILERGPFFAEAEKRLFETHSVDIVVSKNSGGAATYGKIVAARALRLPVIMIGRPPAVASDPVFDIEAAVERVCHFAGLSPKRGE